MKISFGFVQFFLSLSLLLSLISVDVFLLRSPLYFASYQRVLRLPSSWSEQATRISDILSDSHSVTNLTEDEAQHLRDVSTILSEIFWANIFLWIIIIAGFSFLKLSVAQFFHLLRQSTSILFGGLIILGISLLFFWKNFFRAFHEILFPQGNYSFPSTSLLIQTFPDSFWFSSALVLLFLIIIELGIVRTIVSFFNQKLK